MEEAVNVGAEGSWAALRRAFDDAPALVAITVGADHVIAYANCRFEEVFGAGLLGRPAADAVPGLMRRGTVVHLDETYHSGRSVSLNEVLIAASAGSGTASAPRYLTVTFSALGTPPEHVGVVTMAVDITAEVRARAEVDRAAEQVAVLAGEAEVAAEAAEESAGALLLSEQRYRTLIEAISLDVWRADVAGLLITDMPAWRRITGQRPDGSGVTGLGWLDDVHPEDRKWVRTAWLACVDNRRLFDIEYRIRGADGGWRRIHARAAPVVADPTQPDSSSLLEWIGTTEDVTALRESGERSAALERAGAALARAMTVEQVTQVVRTVIRDALSARRAGVALLDQATGAVEVRTAGPGADGAAAEWTLPPEVVRRNRPLFLPTSAALAVAGLTPLDIGGDAVGAETSWVLLPLATRGTALGAMVFSFPDVHRFGPGERTFLLTLAAQCAVALERALLFEEQRGIAATLQDALRPERLPDLPWLDACSHYRPSAGSDVGGDWVEILPLTGGRVAVVLGDVMGRGVRAAAVMGQVRTAVRAYAVLDPEPAAVLQAMDWLFTTFDTEELVTLHYALVTPSGQVRWASAGHLPPLLASRHAPARYLDDGASTPLGVDLGPRSVGSLSLTPDDLLLVVSDGLVETRLRSLGDGLDALRDVVDAELLAETTPSLRGVCDLVVQKLVTEGDTDDDVTVLAYRLRPPAP